VLVALWQSESGWSLAQTFTTLHSFDSGGIPEGALVEGTDGNLTGPRMGMLAYTMG
jgi:hypothetical protein